VNRAHLVPLALAFLAGLLASFHHAGLPALCLASGLGALLRDLPRDVRLCVVAGVAMGVLEAQFAVPAQAPPEGARTSRFAATLVDARALDDERDAVTLRLADGALASASLPLPLPAIGSRLLVRGRQIAFDGPRNPGEPSPRDMEAERGIAWRIARPFVLRSEAPDPRDASLWLARGRAWASQRLHAELGEPEATILAGALWGERSALPPDLRAEFQDTGTVHVLVTAGLHLGVVAAVAYALLALLGCGRRSASLATIAVVWAYALFSGAHLPSLRAATMLSFALLARASGRDAFSWNGLAAAAIVVAALRPQSVESVSFALSFSCVAAIFAFARPLAEAAQRCGVPEIVAELTGVALAAQIGTWPLTASAFLVIAPYAPLANALVVPVVGVAMLVGFAELAVSSVPLLGVAAANVERSLIGWIVGVVRFTSGLPHAHVVATPPPVWALAAYDFALIGAAIALQRKRVVLAIVCVAAGSMLCLWPPRPASHDLLVTAIDVGQADALLIRTPQGHAFLVDAGGRLERGPQLAGTSSAEDVGERVVVPFLVRSGIHHLDAVLLSHPHGDHAGGLPPVLHALGVGAFADSGQTYAGHAYHDALDLARERRVPMLEPRGGDVWRTDDGVTFRFYGPTYPYITGSRSDINSNSLVFRLEYGRFRMLFMGDAGTETEARLLDRGADLRADVLKVGHHGSAYGTTADFVRAVGASAAIVSVGRDNLFGHPSASTLATLLGAGVRAYRTDRDGAVTVRSDGRTYSIAPFLRAAMR
jgi:competence protein ComEC